MALVEPLIWHYSMLDRPARVTLQAKRWVRELSSIPMSHVPRLVRSRRGSAGFLPSPSITLDVGHLQRSGDSHMLTHGGRQSLYGRMDGIQPDPGLVTVR